MADNKKLKSDPVYMAAVKAAGLNVDEIQDHEIQEVQPRDIDLNKVEKAARESSGLKTD